MRRVLLMSIVLSGCSLKKMTVDQTAGILVDANADFQRETDLELAEAALPASLKTIEGFLAAHPTQEELLRMLAEGYTSYAFGFVEDTAERVEDEDIVAATRLRERAYHLHTRARNFGLRLLALDHPKLAMSLKNGEVPTDEQLKKLGADEIAGLFWTAYPWGASINANRTDPGLIAQLPIVRKLMVRCRELDPSYFHAGPLVALASLEAAIPKALGGRPDVAQTLFQEAFSATNGEFLLAKVMYAKAVLVQLNDKAGYQKALQEVVDANPDQNPDLALANRLAQRRAVRYLGQIDDLFL